MRTTIMFAACIPLASCVLASAQSTQSNGQPPQANAQNTPPSAAVTKLIGKVELEPGQKMPFRLSFIDRKAFEEKRITHPVPVTVRVDGTFEIPGLVTLPEGYVLQSTPCVMPKAVMLAGVDILALHGKGPSPFGTAITMSTVADFASIAQKAADVIAQFKAGGVKWSTCGSNSSGGAQ